MGSRDFLHELDEFRQLLEVVAGKLGIEPVLVEKDYWIMHCLYGLKQGGHDFYLKGGTTLSKGYGLINRFSEDIDIQITPPAGMTVHSKGNHNKSKHAQSRKQYYDHLAGSFAIPGITADRDTDFDDVGQYRSGGIRFNYKTLFDSTPDLKNGILLEVGFAQVAPYRCMDFTSWAFDQAIASGAAVCDNRACGIPCYEPGYTLAEKLAAVAKKYRQYQNGDPLPTNFMRHYYDIHRLLEDGAVLEFAASGDFDTHVSECFTKTDLATPIEQNQAFLLDDEKTFNAFRDQYVLKKSLYYKGQPDFGEVIDTIRNWLKERCDR